MSLPLSLPVLSEVEGWEREPGGEVLNDPETPLYKRLLILPLCLVLALSAASAQSRKKDRGETGKEEQEKKKRSDLDLFSSPEEEETPQELPFDLSKRIIVGDQALQEVIRSGRYRVGPGDEFLVTVGGDIRKTFPVPVSAQGQLVIPDVGATDVAGIPLGDALRRIQETIEGRYRGASVIVTLGQLRVFPVDVLGYVKRPGRYMARGVECVSELILRAGGLPKNQGALPSMRNILILRPDRREGLASATPPKLTTSVQMPLVIGRADLLLWQRTGDPTYNPFISDGDVIQVPVKGDSIGIYGAVNMEGYYEFAEGDRISTLIQLGGGLNEGADRKRAELLRLTDKGTTQMEVDLTAVLERDPAHDILLQKGDRLHVLLEKKLVTVEGEVKFPGPYPIQEGKDRLRDILDRAGGVTGEASLEQASVVRWSGGDAEDPEFERLKGFPPQQLTKEQQEYMRFKTRERAGQMAINFVRLLRDNDESENILLSRNDRILIPRASRTVTVSGQVANPSAFLHNPAYGVQDYIRLAGGFSKTAQAKNVRLIKGKTGKWIDADREQPVEPGDTILVPEKPPRDGWRIFLDGMQIVSQIVTIIYLVRATTR